MQVKSVFLSTNNEIIVPYGIDLVIVPNFNQIHLSGYPDCKVLRTGVYVSGTNSDLYWIRQTLHYVKSKFPDAIVDFDKEPQFINVKVPEWDGSNYIKVDTDLVNQFNARYPQNNISLSDILLIADIYRKWTASKFLDMINCSPDEMYTSRYVPYAFRRILSKNLSCMMG